MDEKSNESRKPNIMLIDDTPENLDVLSGMLEKRGYKIRPVTDGKSALKSMEIFPPDLIILDINMADMNGFEVCERIKNDEKLKEIPVIFISALTETDDKVKAFSVGGADYITKPFQHEEVLVRVNTHLKAHYLQIELEKHNKTLEKLVQAQLKEIYDSQMSTIFALAKLAESRDDDTGRHLERVQNLCSMLAREMSSVSRYKKIITPKFIENIFNASPLHDIGKVGISDSILLKPGRFTPEEFEKMKRHSTLGAETLEYVYKRYPKNVFLNMGIEIARHHHERWDGTGYPDKLKGEDIPLCARIMSVIDVYDAMRSKRCYKEPRSHEETVIEILRCSGTQFDPGIAEIFNEIQEQMRDEWEKLKD
jgi:putative two-component system response regulator